MGFLLSEEPASPSPSACCSAYLCAFSLSSKQKKNILKIYIKLTILSNFFVYGFMALSTLASSPICHHHPSPEKLYLPTKTLYMLNDNFPGLSPHALGDHHSTFWLCEFDHSSLSTSVCLQVYRQQIVVSWFVVVYPLFQRMSFDWGIH